MLGIIIYYASNDATLNIYHYKTGTNVMLGMGHEV
jgi:hypothetical protein